jgi:hypothetical protein
MLAHARTGASVSLMMTVNEQVAVRADASVTVQLTVLVPTLNVDPDGGVQLELAPVQLSEMAGGSQTTFALEHWPGFATCTMPAGQVMVGFWSSLIVTVKEQLAVLPEESVFVQLTVVTPVGKVEPEAGVQMAEKAGQLSLAVRDQVTLALLHWPASVLPVIAGGQPMVGFSVSLMVTVKEQEAVLPAASIAVQFTGLTPLAKVEPEGGVQEALTPRQLSEVAGGSHVTLALEHWLASVLATMLPGHMMLGFWASLIMTVNVQDAVCPAASMAVHMTGLEPTGKVEPEGGVQPDETTAQLSKATGGSHTTLALEHWPGSVTCTMRDGQVIFGFSSSVMVTVKVQALVFPLASVAVQVTVVVPTAKVEPIAGVQLVVTPGQLSVAVGVKVTFALEHWLRSALATMLPGQVICGLVKSATVLMVCATLSKRVGSLSVVVTWTSFVTCPMLLQLVAATIVIVMLELAVRLPKAHVT